MAGAGEDQSSFSGNPDGTAVNSSNSQVDEGVIDADDLKYGFQRPEMYKNSLAGTVDPYDRHVFLCYKNAESWPSRVEDAEFDRLPSLLAAALKSRKNEIQGKTRLTICEGRHGTESSNGDILIFPDMVRYRGLTHLDVDNFVENVVVKGSTWVSGAPEALTGSHIFVCSHGSRDRRCGVCGPVLIDKFKEETESRGLNDQVFVSPCSHIGGHKYAGNLIIFSSNSEGKVAGHWYGYVTPDDVPILLEQHIGKGEIVERLWRGQMGSSNEKEENEGEHKHQENVGMANNGTNLKKGETEPKGSNGEFNLKDVESYCQGANGFSCCRNEEMEVKSEIAGKKQRQGTDVSKNMFGNLTAWAETWEQSDILAAVAVIGTVATVAVACSFYRRSG
ncbi:altered inheritance of mitochondria protein 32-like [Telopea speciosissima]|uniref:altered inheritance of mitochondria protein 32-like n=1 Tax=Telopea speciosissima TaxID=54955 RepID=UPI001CC43AB5|nr:altered inheritance of mitochondria protein 32-like [Telopea speciosissima]